MTLLLHPQTRTEYESIINSRSHGYVFAGNSSSGRLRAALTLARRFACEAGDGDDGCAACRLVDAGSSPNVTLLSPPDGKGIGVSEVRELVRQTALASYDGRVRRLIIIDGADTMSVPAQNALLKLAEEPPAGAILVLIATDLAVLLPTLRSRLAVVWFRPVALPDVAAWLERATGAKPSEAAAAADRSGGRPGVALSTLHAADGAAGFAAEGQQAYDLLERSCFERLIAVRAYAEASNSTEIATSLQNRVVEMTRRGEMAASKSSVILEALERYRQAIAANVGARPAMERLVLELP